ncbi:MAG: mononuclear molybdenum enzyme YedY [Rhodospirillales bacterium 70-18]|nr:MAG: mononuclear molybdenum enzyme YedY [Rhodospirillales bacterium 70-18]
MFIHRRRGWEIPESQATPEQAVRGRRGVLAGLAGAAGLVAAAPARAAWFSSLVGGGEPAKPVALAPLPAPHNARYDPKRLLTNEGVATSYNNYYEFGLSKSIAAAAQALPTDPWTIHIEGMVEKPRAIGLEDLLKQVKLEERIYRHRCVEAWAMTVPWTGFPLADLVKLAAPLASAKYMVFTTLADSKTMPGLRQSFYPWPYTEGVTMQEAANELAFLSVGMFGKTIPPQDGAPIRLTLPWKYGFKSAKSIVKVTFTDKQPVTFWEALQSSEYGFWANVNPAVPHPRWSQAQERLIGTDDTVPTRIWNGYGEYVAAMYDNLKNERLFA